MPQDAFTLRHLCREFNEVFAKGKINRITEPNDDEVVLTVYNGKSTDKLCLDVNPSSPKMAIIREEKDSLLTAPNFCMLLRKYLLLAEIESIELVGFDRIVKISCRTNQEFKDSEEITLFVELMGRYSNIILTQGGKVLGCNRGINMIYNGVRPLIYGKPYVLPPVQEKRLPSDESLIEDFKAFSGDSLSKYLCEKIQGVASSTAEELIREYVKENGEYNVKDCRKFFEFQRDFLYGEKTNPCVLIKGGKTVDACAFPYGIGAEEIKYFDKLYLAEEYYFSEKNKVKDFNDKKSRLSSKVNTALKKYKKKLSAFLSKEKEANDCEINRVKGELILANIYKIKQGETKVSFENYYDENKLLTIELDERLSPSKNAESYYKKYNKQKRTLETLIPQIEQVKKEIEYLESILDEMETAEVISDLSAISNEMKEYGLIEEQTRTTGKKKKEEKPFRVYDIDGFTVRLGRNNLENDKLLGTARQTDIWIHAKDYHSSHVIISAEKEVPDNVILTAMEICAYYSKGREGGKVEIAYTERRNVKKPPKCKPGFVIYDNFKTEYVKADKHEEKTKSE